ncbi:hypothetical protein FFLO_07102 [Filobasidium floriforme]|uniref:AAA+ ATPase domain-containing protein n=1 Tax=Filobasidium floriforme TaxID=5210 RepID=A0A8K0NPV1_9TREE|nr:P-loop containing nucleoside triphosphate hydrolase protein [Filobasidium floriforme]KAG7527272.1 hypothetical protein FFLO_07102 [Filobasidium floriforme]KAH8084287.1 P-loop containing nucleoside triphosphate hydrolase protein [Filobasidium floriforme]
MPSSKRREGDGGVGTQIDFAGWQVWWRGIEFDVWQARYFDPIRYSYVVQSHIIGRSPQEAFPLVVPPSTSSSPILSSASAADLLILEIAAWNSEVRDAILVFDSGYWQVDRKLWDSVQKADWKDVILPTPLKSSVRHEYRSFFSSERIYKDLDVAWKRGVIFLGPPGNGKTISVKAMMRGVANGEGVGKETKRVLYVRSFHTYAGDEYGIKQVFERARREAPCLVVFEDIDSLITDNNRSFFLNEVDGLEDNDGLLMLATTNHFDRLDPALSNRPSRFDRKYTFPDPNKSERRQYAVYWQDKLANNDRIKFPNKLLDEFAAKTDGFSFAYMKEAFVSALLILAGDETNDLTFPRELMAQVAALRKELDSDK